MENLRVFNNVEFGEIRSIVQDGEPWFVGKDVANALGYSNHRDALSKWTDEDDKGVVKCDTPGGPQDMIIINESGLYSLIFSSKLPKAKEFKHWVTSKVLPSIRNTGTYALPTVTLNITALSGFASTVNTLRRIMREQGSTPQEIARMAAGLCNQFGIVLPEQFVHELPGQVPGQMSLLNSIN